MGAAVLVVVAATCGLLAGAALAWFFMRAQATAAFERGGEQGRIDLVALQGRYSALGEQLETQKTQTVALSAELAELRAANAQVRDEKAQLAERTMRIPDLERQLTELRGELHAAHKQLNEAVGSEAEKAEGLSNAVARTAELQRELAARVTERDRLNTELSESNSRAASLEAQLKQLPLVRDELDAERARREAADTELRRVQIELAQREAEFAALRDEAAKDVALLNSAREEFSNHFRTVANQILEEKSQRFTEQNKTNLDQLLAPLQLKITEFKTKVEEVYVQESKDRTAMAEQVKQLMSLNQGLSEDAKNLTLALKGSSKAQGNWGELILERVLEMSGLEKGKAYELQQSFMRQDGSRAQPDAVIRLPGGKHMVVDSKVSLSAYEKFVSATTSESRQEAVDSHLESVRAHIKGLSGKEYQSLPELGTLDFVFMFVPVEPAFMLALQHDDSLLAEAWSKNVLLVSPSTLLFALRTVAHLWRQEAQRKNAQEIADRGAKLYDKLVGFVEDLNKVGDRIRQAQESYDSARGKLIDGKGNAISHAEKLKQLGVKPTKQLPDSVLAAGADDDLLTEEAVG